jgi:hypothetical protein
LVDLAGHVLAAWGKASWLLKKKDGGAQVRGVCAAKAAATAEQFVMEKSMGHYSS